MGRTAKVGDAKDSPVAETAEAVAVPEPERPIAEGEMPTDTSELPAPAPTERGYFVREFVRVRNLGAIGQAFLDSTEVERRTAGEAPSRRTLSEWDSIYKDWAAKPR